MSSDPDSARRAQERASWPGGKTDLTGADGAENLADSTTVEQRLAMMWPLAVSAWALTGLPMPTYERSQIPGRVIRPGKK